MEHIELSRSAVARRAGTYVFLVGAAVLLTGCLASAVTNLSQSISDAVAPKVTFFVPAKNAEAGAIKSVLVVSDSTNVSQQVAMEFETQMSKLRINERPYFTKAKLGPRFNGQLADAQLAELAKINGVDAVYVLTGGNTDVKTANSTEEIGRAHV